MSSDHNKSKISELQRDKSPRSGQESEAVCQIYRKFFDRGSDGYLVTDPEGNIQEANSSAAEMLCLDRDQSVEKPLIVFVQDTDQTAFRECLSRLREGTELSGWELQLRSLDGKPIPASISAGLIHDTACKPTGLYWLIENITARKKNEMALQAASAILKINNSNAELKPFLNECVDFFKELSGCAAVGIRLLESDGKIPYQAYDGFTQSFFEKESPLSIKSDLCMCINVIKGETDPALPFYTSGGSFYMNATTRFLATVSEEAKGETRNVCNKVGFESVALVPIRLKDRILGLIHLADTRENMVPQYLVEVLEQAGAQLGVALDRVQVQQALRENESILRSFFDAPGIMRGIVEEVAADDVRHIVDNAAAAEPIGLTPEAMRNKLGSEIGEPREILRHWIGFYEKSRRTRKPVSFEYQDKRGNKDVWLSATVNYLGTNPSGQPKFAYVVIDITERKQAEGELQKSENRFRALIQNLSSGVALVDEYGKFIVYNPAFLQMFGLPEGCGIKNVNDQRWGDWQVFEEDGTLLHVDNHPVRKAAITGRPVRNRLVGVRLPVGGDLIWMLVSAEPILKPDGRIDLLICTYVDITERKLMEEALRRAHEELEQKVLVRTAELSQAKEEVEVINEELRVEIDEHRQTEEALLKAKEAAEVAVRAKSYFMANMSHEIRTPMNAVIGMTSVLLDDGTLNPEQKDFIETIRINGDALMVIINDILDFSKMESEKATLEEQPFDLRGNVEEALDLVSAGASEKGLNLAYTIDKTVPEFIIGDPTRLRQILGNLLNNAVKFTENGEVTLNVSSRELDTGQEIHFAVRDTGIGIPAEQMSHLFQPFAQVDATVTRKYGGTGLGLAISRKLVELMEGRIWVESIPGKGSTFHFTIHAEAVPEGRKTLAGVQPQLAGKSVLIVDDNRTNRRILGAYVYSWGMSPLIAASGKDALGWIQRGDKFDIAILDMDMPEMDGLALAKKIRDYNRVMPLVLLTTIDQRIDSGLFVAKLFKPIKPSQLHKILTGTFSVKRARKAARTDEIKKPVQISPLKILLAEDNASSQKVALQILMRLGYRADVAANGLEVLQALERQPYDLVLMDVRMPEMDGLEATRVIRQRWPDDGPKIVAITAFALEGDREMCLAAGMDDYVSKPIRKDELAAALGKYQASGRDGDGGKLSAGGRQ